MKQTIELTNEEIKQAVTDMLTKKFKGKDKENEWTVAVGTKMVPQGYGTTETDVPAVHITASREI